MFKEVTCFCYVAIPTKDLDNNGLIHQSGLLATHLLKYLLHMKSTENHGYFLTVTNLKCNGKGKTNELHLGCIYFPIVFTCRTFMPCVGETMLGVVHQVHKAGAFLRCGPIRVIYLSSRKMAGYHNFVPGEKDAFLNDSLSRIEVDVVVRFRVLDVRWVESAYISRREFHVVATLEGDSLGPVSLSGSDELDLL